jgi:23S rRNA (pseudouridine1915-N3)-methyltransferase
MKLTLSAVGKAKDGPERVLFRHYADRLRWSFDLREVEEKKKLSGPALKEREAELLLGTIPDGAFLVALDEHGKQPGSVEFAHLLENWRDQSGGKVAFAIGGADGHGPPLLARAGAKIAFGRMTWPHMLVRGLLAEQLFRAQCILDGHPYHRE